jgi:hypothetical protein
MNFSFSISVVGEEDLVVILFIKDEDAFRNASNHLLKLSLEGLAQSQLQEFRFHLSFNQVEKECHYDVEQDKLRYDGTHKEFIGDSEPYGNAFECDQDRS